MSQDLAPVILFIYNRPDHTRKTLEALRGNLHADNTLLYVFADGPKEGAGEGDLKKIAETRAVAKEKPWCKEVILVNREKNLGSEENPIDAITQVMQKHGKAIMLDDDLITSPYFLKYCNDGLTAYENTKNVFSINAFMYPVDFGDEATTFLCPLATNPWGWATWADRWELFERDPKFVSVIDNSNLLKNRYNFGNINWFGMLRHLNTYYDRWYYTAFLQNGMGLFPTKSLVYNIGFDNTGVHPGFSTPQQSLHLSPIELVCGSSIDLRLYAKLLYHFRMKKPTVSRRLINGIKKQLNYKNYNEWWNQPGQTFY